MFERITPERAGISSAAVSKFIRKLEERGLYTHGVLLMRGNDIFAECYWAPYNKDSIHRMYSQTKSFVGIAIGLLEQDGLIGLDDPIADHFPEKIRTPLDPRLAKQTIRQMLLMETVGSSGYWFFDETAVDRTEYYFRTMKPTHPAGTFWAYDSPGSQVLCSLVEKLTGMPMLEYLKQKLFNEMGTFQTAKMLKTRNNDSFGDSAMICTLRDMASFGRLLMQEGRWEGKQLINAPYVREATSCLVDNDENGFGENFHVGYGYQIWQAPRGGFAFVGMGGQLTVCLPQQDLLFTCISDGQGHLSASGPYPLILAALYDFIVDELQDAPLPEDPAGQAQLQALCDSRKLKHLPGKTDSPFASRIDGVRYVCQENPTGITEFTFRFAGDGTGTFHYTNAQGKKVLPFGLGKNVFGKFPQLGYATDHACIPTSHGEMYDCAVSAAWREEKKLVLKVQIIDEYLGSFFAVFAFHGTEATVSMTKHAEAFLMEYQGIFNAAAEIRDPE